MWKNIGTDMFLNISLNRAYELNILSGTFIKIYQVRVSISNIISGLSPSANLHWWLKMHVDFRGNAFPNESGNYFCSGFNINILIWEHLHKPVSRQLNFSYHNSWPNHIIGLSCCFDLQNKTLLTLWLCSGQIDPKILVNIIALDSNLLTLFT